MYLLYRSLGYTAVPCSRECSTIVPSFSCAAHHRNSLHRPRNGINGASVSPACFCHSSPNRVSSLRRHKTSCRGVEQHQATSGATPPILRIPPPILAAGGLDPAQDGPEALAKFTQHLASNYTPVNIGSSGATAAAADGSPGPVEAVGSTGFGAAGVRVLNIDPPVVTIKGFLTAEQCDALVEAANGSGRMAQSGVGGHNVDRKSSIRTSRTLAMTSEILQEHPDLDAALGALLSRARQLLPAAPQAGPAQFSRPSGPGQVSFELPQVAHYTQGQHFLSHEDAFPPDIAQQKGYQRRATLLVYLNDVQQGGQTKFDFLGFGVQPAKGQALLFFPSYQWCAPDRRTLHTAEDAADDKWVCQLWLSSGLPLQQQQQQHQQQAAKKAGKVQLPPGLQPARRGNPGARKRK